MGTIADKRIARDLAVTNSVGNRQRSDLIAATRRVSEAEQALLHCECGSETAPFSCYCRVCEDAIYSDV